MKKISFVLSFLICLLLCSCGSSTPKSAELTEKYDFYKSSISGLKTATGVTAEEADELFIVLASECGVDSFFTVTKNTSGGFYNVNYGLNTLEVYLDGNTISEVYNKKDKIYPETVLHNFLMDSELTVKDVMNGSGDTVIGQRAYIRLGKDQLEEMTADHLREFAENRVEGSGYNWVSIIVTGGNGICFPGSDTTFAIYGKLDEEGMLEETIGTWTQQSDGSYIYSEN